MKTKTLKKNKVNVVTLGCSKNLVDSEVLMGQLKANKFDVEHEGTSDDHQIVIINTCGFVDNAKQDHRIDGPPYRFGHCGGHVQTMLMFPLYPLHDHQHHYQQDRGWGDVLQGVPSREREHAHQVIPGLTNCGGAEEDPRNAGK